MRLKILGKVALRGWWEIEPWLPPSKTTSRRSNRLGGYWGVFDSLSQSRQPCRHRCCKKYGESYLNANDLSALLWRERALLDQVLLNLETKAFLPHGGGESGHPLLGEQLMDIIVRLRLVELARSVEVSSLAKEWKIPEDHTLSHLVAHAPTGVWAQILGEHLAAMTAQALRIRGLQKSIEDLPQRAAHLTRGNHKKRMAPPRAAATASDLKVVATQALPGTLQEFLGLSMP
ncbi:hypothetical protein [Paenarthrobacter ureafaciens]|uniref:hypothetical protein n=1 Tax=Paenarthrobacter ureafaciens TaxID=37931 RepID=UPI002271807B|nr:hypothetical protein [Paenarthrobacter ureafaciens]MCY0975619.1 hypothetical protein [Paenarthrobacter ureafaciens]